MRILSLIPVSYSEAKDAKSSNHGNTSISSSNMIECFAQCGEYVILVDSER